MRSWDCLFNYIARNLPKVKLTNGRWYEINNITGAFLDCNTGEVFNGEPHILELRFPINESVTIVGGSDANGG